MSELDDLSPDYLVKNMKPAMGGPLAPEPRLTGSSISRRSAHWIPHSTLPFVLCCTVVRVDVAQGPLDVGWPEMPRTVVRHPQLSERGPLKTLSPAITAPACFSAVVRLAAILALCCTSAAVAAKDAGTPIPKGSKLYIEEIEAGLDQHIAAAIFERKLPLKLVAVVEGADYLLRGTFLSVPRDDDGAGHTGYAAASLVDMEGTIVWAVSAIDASEYGTGVIGVAREIAKQLEKAVQKN